MNFRIMMVKRIVFIPFLLCVKHAHREREGGEGEVGSSTQGSKQKQPQLGPNYGKITAVLWRLSVTSITELYKNITMFIR